VSNKIDALKMAEKAYMSNLDSINRQFNHPKIKKAEHTLANIDFKKSTPKNNSKSLFKRDEMGKERGF
jgi:hypothetical protein